MTFILAGKDSGAVRVLTHKNETTSPDASLKAVRHAVSLYPDELRESQESDLPRLVFQLDLVRSRIPAGGKVLDVGGGIGAFTPALAAAGFDATLVDDFRDTVNIRFPTSMVGVHDRLGIRVIEVDATTDDFSPEAESFDAITCVDTIEHWHRSPKRTLHKMVAALRPGGLLMIGMPNCVDLRKRFTVPLGRAKWSPMEDWYEEPVFRSHVREPDVADLLYIGRDLQLQNLKVLGRNWAAVCAKSSTTQAVARVLDRILRLRPALCSDLYLIGTRA